MNHPRILLAGLVLTTLAFGSGTQPPDRQKAQKLMNDGNYKEAYEAFSVLALDPADEPRKVGEDLANAIQCLNNINRNEEVDAFRDKVIAAHADNWRLLWAAAQTFLNGEHYGYQIAGEFKRGGHRGGGLVMNPYLRDRARALQLCAQAMPLADDDANKSEAAQFYLAFSDSLMGASGYNEAWRLQDLTDLATLPDYEEGWWYHGYGGSRGAPVDEAGNPVFHKLPKSWNEAKTDGERWRWALSRAGELGADSQARWKFAEFHQQQFDVQTLADYGHFFGRAAEADETRKDESGTWEIHTLGEDETIAKLATGIKRFKLPDEFNYIRIFRELQNFQQLADIFTNRRQYEKAAECWVKYLEQANVWARLKDKPYTHRDDTYGWNQLCQIRGNWGSFEPVATQTAGPTVEYRFRNGKKVHFEAHALDVPKLLADVKAYIETKPKQLDWDKMSIHNIGWLIVQKNQKQYVGEKVAAWDLDLEPRPHHFDRRITVPTPLRAAGAYLVSAQMEGGNESLIVLWVADTVLLKKHVDQGAFYYVADAQSGQPVPKANLEFFGYRQEWVNEERGQGHHRITTKRFAEFADADGQLILDQARQPNDHQWIISATTPEGRLAWLGFTHVWYGQYHDAEYNQTKVYVITDRPVYRPDQPVKFKVWFNKAQYDREGNSPYAGGNLIVQIQDPRGEKLFEKKFRADDFGGFDGEFTLPPKATLGVYNLSVVGHGGGTFRVEEYKKPEFEVKINAPTEPVTLGEKVTAKIQAKYYFGAPVTEAKVKYKVQRTEYDARWYPTCRWDWFYGPGYWWFAPDYEWWPGWGRWGCCRPIPWWWWEWNPRVPPETVAEGEAPIGEDGTISVQIDTSIAKAVHPDRDHRYEVTAEVTDQSRRTIVGQGEVLVARNPFKVYVWMDRGWYRTGDDIQADFIAQTLDRKPVADAKAFAKLFKVSYDKDGQPVEKAVQTWDFATDAEGRGRFQIKAAEAGQYRLSVTVTDSKDHAIEGGYVFLIRGEGFQGGEFRFNDIELVTDKAEYKPGDSVNLMVNVNRRDAPVLLFVRPANGVYLKPKLLRIQGKSAVEAIEVVKRDMPNFFVEAVTVGNGKVHSEMREVVVPPESRALDLAIEPSAAEYKPGEKARFKIKVADSTGEPYANASLVVSLYDKSVEYISGGSNVPEIKAFFWKWRRHHRMQTEDSLDRGGNVMIRPNTPGMVDLGVFGNLVDAEIGISGIDDVPMRPSRKDGNAFRGRAKGDMMKAALAEAVPCAPAEAGAFAMDAIGGEKKERDSEQEAAPMVQPTVRTKFADTALWVAALKTDAKGQAEVELAMPENLTAWKARAWAMGGGARCGEGSAEVVTKKNLILRLQAPRFFVQKDEVVLSANVHNYLKGKKTAKVVLELQGETLEPMGATEISVEIDPEGEKRVDWRVRVLRPGEAVVRMKALTDEESDAMEMRFPVYVHGMLKTESFCGVVAGGNNTLTIDVPEERRPEETHLEIRYSPTLAMAMVDALPYLVDYPYGCTEQTLNRFLPTAITQKALLRMGVSLEDIQKKITNLNAQEIGDDAKRAADWQRLAGTKRWDGENWVDRSPVFDEKLVDDMVKAGVEKLTSMQNSDGGWGWFSGWGEQSYPHTTAVVVHGLQVARENDIAIVPGVIDRGVAWLKGYQAKQVELLKNPPPTRKEHADDTDAFVFMVLSDEKDDNADMRGFLFRDRTHISVYAKSMFALALHKLEHHEERDQVRRNIEQVLVQDDENQTAYLNLGNEGYWWCWYGSEYEAHAYYLKLLAAVDPKGPTASRLVKYLINNRRHATYWHSTRDTAYVIEAFADYIKASGEDKPDMEVEILVDGKSMKKVKITAENLFTYDNKLVMKGAELASGKHQIELRMEGGGKLYWNAYLTNFTLEDPITRAGLEVKVDRRMFKLVPVDKKIKDAGSRGQVVDRKVEKFERVPLENDALLKSGDLVEVELVMESKNDYEYILFEDMKAAGFEAVDVRSGYGGNAMGAYMELRDERVTFFVRSLARGKHSLSYRLRAEIPGRFSALPALASAMYAPELKANSDELKLRIED